MILTTEAIQQTLNMFAFLAVELTLLFLLISYLVGVLQHYIPPSKIQSILSSRGGRGYLIATLLGAITPFCSCSTIPFLKGLIRAKAGFGTMMTFLFASPLLNPIVIALLVATFGIKVATLYFAVAMGVSMLAGFALEKLGFEKAIKKQEDQEPIASSCSSNCGTQQTNKWLTIWHSTWRDFKSVLPYLLVGISIGSIIYGFVPSEFIARFASDDNPLAIPVAAIIGVPLYVRATTVIPLSAALAAKGMGLGAVMALIIGSAGASLTEVILLKSLFNNRLIAAFLLVVFAMAVFAGVTYSWLF